MASSNEDKSNSGAFIFYEPKKAGEEFIKYYLKNNNDKLGQVALKDVSERILGLGTDRTEDIYKSMENILQLNVKHERYEMAAKVRDAINYYKNNILDKINHK